MKTETVTFVKDHRGGWYFANTEKYRVEFYPETNAVLVIDDQGEHVAYKLEDNLLMYADSTNGDFLENEDPFLAEVENRIKEITQ